MAPSPSEEKANLTAYGGTLCCWHWRQRLPNPCLPAGIWARDGRNHERAGTAQLLYQQLEKRLRLGTAARGAAILTLAALVTTVVLVLITNAFGFSQASLASARAILVLALLSALVYALALPLLYLDRRSAVGKAENAFPQFKQRLVTFAERDLNAPDADAREPFIELLAADTLEIARGSEPKALVPQRTLLVSAASSLLRLAC